MSNPVDLSVVLELGSSHLRAGSPQYFPSEHEPFVRVETAARVAPAQNGAEAGATAAVGDGVPSTSTPAAADGQLVCPIVGGEIKDWDALEALMDHVLYTRMGWTRGEEGPLLLAEPILTSRDERERLCQLAFEVFNVPSFFAADQAVLALYCIGRLSGLVVDVGLDKIDIAPVVDGLMQGSAAKRLPYGGRQLTQHLQQLIAKRAAADSAALGPMQLSFEAAEALKRAVFRVGDGSASSLGGTAAAVAAPAAAALAPGASEPRGSTPPAAVAGPTTHTLPDGQTITVGGEGLELGEALLKPSLLELDLPPLAALAQAAVSVLEDKAARKSVAEGVVVCGGGSGGGFASGLPPRLLREMRALAPSSQVLTLAPIPEYLPPQALPNASWLGGAVLAKFVFQPTQVGPQQAVSKADYEEFGPAAVHRRCS